MYEPKFIPWWAAVNDELQARGEPAAHFREAWAVWKQLAAAAPADVADRLRGFQGAVSP